MFPVPKEILDVLQRLLLKKMSNYGIISMKYSYLIMKNGGFILTVKYITKAGVIAAVYAAVTLLLAPISFGHNIFQCRISEALTVLPMFTSAAIPGLFVGCIIANLIGGMGLLDIIFGSLATLIAAILSYRFRENKWLVPLFPVILNMLIVGGYLTYIFAAGGDDSVTFPIMAFWVGLGELIACYGLGLPLILFLQKHGDLLKS